MRKVLAFVSWLCIFGTVNGQYRFISFGVADGLSQNSVNCIYQDTDGLLWLGTQDGLNSFDGHNFKVYKYDEKDTTTISDQFVLSITEDNDGFLWIATRNGLNRLNKRTGKFQRKYEPGQAEASVGRPYGYMQRNRRGDILAVYGIVPLVLQMKGIPVPLERTVYHPVFDSNGDVWGVDSLRRLVQTLRTGNFQKQVIYKGHPGFGKEPERIKITTGNDHVFWCYTTGRKGEIFFFDAVKKQWEKEFISIPDMINDIQVVSDGTGWVSTIGGVYLVKDGKVVQHLYGKMQDQTGLPPGSILCSFEDRQGNIWLGSAGSGFAYYHPGFDHFNVWHTGIQKDVVTAIVSFGSNEKWIGANSGLHKMMVTNIGSYKTKVTCTVCNGHAYKKTNDMKVEVHNEF